MPVAARKCQEMGVYPVRGDITGGVPMKPLMIVGIVLIVIGVVALAYQGVTYTSREKVVDIGPLKVEAKREKTIPLPPILGGVAIAAGVVLMIAGARR
jgi:hypothetical protein